MRIPKEWRQQAKNPFPRLKEYWYQMYLKEHPNEFGFSDLEGPFETGVDFKGVYNSHSVTIEVERDYVSYIRHAHPIFDVLVVGVIDAPHPDMLAYLPKVIIYLDPQKVMDWSKEARHSYRAEMDERRKDIPKQWEFVEENSNLIREVRLKNERLEVDFKDQLLCECGGVMVEAVYQPEIDGELTEGQSADYMAGLEARGTPGFWKTFECLTCGKRGWSQG